MDTAARLAPIDGPQVTTQVYVKVGGLEAAIDKQAEDVFRKFPEEQEAIERLFQRLTDRRDGDKAVRKPETLPVLEVVTGLAADRLTVIVEAFVHKGLLITRLLENGAIEVDLPHECLAWKWKRLVAWIDEEFAEAKSLRFLSDSVAKQLWLVGSVLKEAKALHTTGRLDSLWAQRYLSAAELSNIQSWITKSEARERAEEERLQRDRQRAIITAIAAGLVALLVGCFAWWAFQQKSAADVARVEALNQKHSADLAAKHAELEKGRADSAATVAFSALEQAKTAAQRAESARQNAQVALGVSETEKQIARNALARSYVNDGMERLEYKDRPIEPGEALAYFARAVRTEPNSYDALSAVTDRSLRAEWWMPAAVLRHRDAVVSVAFSPDGRRVVTASNDDTARVWDAETGKALGAPLQHQDIVNSAAFSPDGRRMVTASDDKTARVWDAETGKAVGAPLHHQDIVNSAAFSPGGRRVVTASNDNTARVWDAETGKAVGAPLQHQDIVNSAAFSPDGRRVVTASNDNTARVWDAETGKAVGAPLQHQGMVKSAAFSPDRRRVVTASEDKTARVWDAETGKAVGAPLQHQGIVNSAAFSPDGRRVVTASNDQTARVWDAETGKAVGAPLQHQGMVNSAAFSPDGRRVVTASWDNTARVWDVMIDCCASQAEAERLADLAETLSGLAVSDTGALYAVEFDRRERLVELARLARPNAPRLSLDWLIRDVAQRFQILREQKLRADKSWH